MFVLGANGTGIPNGGGRKGGREGRRKRAENVK